MKSVTQTNRLVSVWVFVVGAGFGCASAPPPSFNLASLKLAAEVISPPQDPNRVALGRLLFHDPRLSRNREVSCSTCHALSKFGIDGKVVSTGVDGRRGRRNAPSVFNAGTHVAQFWDGRAADVEAQAMGPITNPVEMDMPDEQSVVDVLSVVPAYAELFRRAFPTDERPITLRNVGEAIGAFERGLVTTSRWDKFIAGDQEALTKHEKQGLSLFMQRGCITCHTGSQVGGNSFQKVGTVVAWPNQTDQGRSEITNFPPDRMVFKVPSLKNIAQTGPYFHDGSTTTLEKAIQLMAYHQLGIELPREEVEAMAAWMRSMTGEPDPSYIAPPRLPPG